MKTVTDAEILAFHSGTQKTLKLTFSNGTVLQNDSIVSESLEIKQSISESDQISFATVYASELHISVLPLTRFKGLDCTVEITAGSYSRVLGTYTIVSDDSLSDYSARQLVGYDKLYSIIPRDYSVWHNGLDTQLTGTITLKQYRDAFFSLIGITQQEATLPNDNLAVNLPSLNTTLTGGQILGMICDLNQCWGYLEFDGTFRYVLPERSATCFRSIRTGLIICIRHLICIRQKICISASRIRRKIQAQTLYFLLATTMLTDFRSLTLNVSNSTRL